MTIKSTPLSIENELKGKVEGFHARANAIKQTYHEQRQDILKDDRLNDAAKTGDLAALADATSTELKAIKAEQISYVAGLRTRLEKELAGNQPTDASSVLLRRDASERARNIEDERTALAALQDAIANDDASMAHAIGAKGRRSGWLNVSEAWQSAHPGTAGVAEALDYVEGYTTSGAYNLANSMSFSDPAA
ncbi:hypothetical protein ACFQZV_07270 [Microbacterium koreense]|uniref:Phage major capsid protein n=1 Tax=Microbacterium koreense TaxID=323761 RepID=A0ABW2ZRU1_9MICO